MKYISWLDIKNKIRKETDNFRILPQGIKNLHFYPDEIIVEQKEENADTVKAAFEKWFPNPDTYAAEDQRIYLDIARSSMEISIETNSEGRMGLAERPRFDQLYFSKVFLSDDALKQTPKPRHKIIAFHSFKGGVGRTLHLAAMIKSLSDVVKKKGMEKKVLIIDGDLEAPGITFWEKNKVGGTANIGFTQFLDAVQYADPDTDYTMEAITQYFAEEIQRFEQVVETTKLYVLPAFSDPADLFHINVKPEHLSHHDRPWKLRECIDRLAGEINADYVFIDLRAGISELSAPFLLDPYIDRFLVTTLSEQSISGTELILKEMAKINMTENKVKKTLLPEILISMVSPDQDDKRLIEAKARFDKTIFGIENAAGTDPDTEGELLSDPIAIKQTPFKSELLGVRSWEDVWQNGGSLIQTFTDYFEGLEESEDEDSLPGGGDHDEQLKKLKDFCSNHVFAENVQSGSFLKTGFFKEFPRQYFRTLPLVVSLGTKGAGKTFHFMRMTQLMAYKKFCDSIEPDKVEINADFFPILRSSEIDGESDIIQQLKSGLPLFDAFDYDDFTTSIERFRDEEHSESEWKDFWGKKIIQAVSGNNDNITSFRQLNETLKDKPLVLLIDGLENFFPDIHSSEKQQNAISALLNIPGRLSEIRERHMGLIIFLRQDYLDSAKRQNSGQLEKKYENYKLLWDETAFLRLVFWLAITSGALETERALDPSAMGKEQLNRQLKKLWGLKLGQDKSKEAYTINWVYGALSDFKGYLQARDVVRFLAEAAKESEILATGQWKGRLLPPAAIRKAINGCSTDRVKELKQESKVFRKWTESLESQKEELVIPFSKSLLPEDSRELKKLGVVYEDISDSGEEFRFYIPEIYRLGLGFKFKSGARPKVLSIKRKAVGKGLLS
ncbi:MinD-like ATPase involved in chromosome partitioning or flagellar assembly [Desulfocicer vacuolatum DSM 3385]|uniref:MinD-like ATPase involved in chromosome partitioning or flagellar assembly n=1 Tax=Desulfocicer vacuolatum DSM 3385 TaxID=1121400 RepID=A0A1W2CPX9_9BACT|nr:ParA family protein [Desulfocicer vacuolatum]SMC87261.1 MinD-like ATPase involved in chromosome partitioning or flagellar assembly [Desulfocicer vacuolatum DSM 3385]